MDLHLLPYQGVIDWKDFLVTLIEIQFEGCFSLETAPPYKLSNAISEEMSTLLVKIAEEKIS